VVASDDPRAEDGAEKDGPASRARANTASGSVMNTVSKGLKADSSGMLSSIFWTAIVLKPAFIGRWAERSVRTRHRIDDAANVPS